MLFPGGKAETSDFFDTKYGCFALKVRMFVSKKSDVFVPEHAHFMIFFPLFLKFLRQNAVFSTDSSIC